MVKNPPFHLNAQIKNLVIKLEKSQNEFLYLAVVHTKAHQVIPGCLWTKLNNHADIRSRRAVQNQLKSWMLDNNSVQYQQPEEEDNHEV